jgi:hypothetical protein
LKNLTRAQKSRKVLLREGIAERVKSALEDIPALMKNDPLRAKAKLSEHVERITLSPQSSGTYSIEGEWDLLVTALRHRWLREVDLNQRPLGYEFSNLAI